MKGKLLTIEINNDDFVDLQKEAIPAAIGIKVKEFQPNIFIAKCTGQMQTKDRGMKDFVDMQCLFVVEEKDASKDIERWKLAAETAKEFIDTYGPSGNGS